MDGKTRKVTSDPTTQPGHLRLIRIKRFIIDISLTFTFSLLPDLIGHTLLCLNFLLFIACQVIIIGFLLVAEGNYLVVLLAATNDSPI